MVGWMDCRLGLCHVPGQFLLFGIAQRWGGDVASGGGGMRNQFYRLDIQYTHPANIQ